jgi:uncharacterized protein
VITELGVGEVLVSMLDEKGSPTMVERAFVVPPEAHIGPISADERSAIIKGSVLAGHYEAVVDRESAYEKLKGRTAQKQAAATQPANAGNGLGDLLGSILGGGSAKGTGRQRQGVVEALAKSAARSIGSEVGRQIIRGVLGSILGGKR